jgi:glycosyltransferase involved in cell wall biosynthesis
MSKSDLVSLTKSVPMRILYVLPSLSLKLGGPTQAALNFVINLRSQGIDCEIATTNDDGADLLDVSLSQPVVYCGVPVHFFHRDARMKEFIVSISLTKWLWQHIPDYDLIHTHYLFSYAPTVAATMARWYKVPYIMRTIGQLTPWALTQSRIKKQIYATLIERSNLNKAAAVHCTTSEEAQNVESFGISSLKIVLPLGVTFSPVISQASQQVRELYQIPKDIPIVLFLSRLHPKKRPDLLIEAISQLSQEGQAVHLILAGEGDDDYTQYLKNLALSLKLNSQITFAGFVAGADKQILLQGADIFALLSYSENFGIAVAEALAAGLPVLITPDIQIASDIQSSQAGIVVSGELEEIKNALCQLLNSSELRHQLGENGKILAQTVYNWSNITEQLIQSYADILKNNSSSTS